MQPELRCRAGAVNIGIVAGSASAPLAEAVAGELQTALVPVSLERFPDGEMRPAVGHVRGDDLYVFQPTGPPVSETFFELLLLLDACRRAGAHRLTAVVPYFGYARQDRRSRDGQSVGSRLAAHLVAGAGADRVVVVDPHTAALEAMFDIPVERLTAVPALAEAARTAASDVAVVVAPDLGAVKLAEHYARLLDLPVAVIRKTRLSGMSVTAEGLIGDVAGLSALIVDDMISTGATIEAAAGVLRASGASAITVAATHGLFVGPAERRLRSLELQGVLVADGVASAPGLQLAVQAVSIAPLLGVAIGNLHHNRPLDDLLGPA